MSILGVSGVMTLTAIPFQHNSLGKSISGKVNLLDIVRSCQIWIGHHTCKVHNNAVVYKFFDRFRPLRDVHDISESQRAVIPVKLIITVDISCDADLRARKFAYRIIITTSFLSILITIFIVPHCACKAHGIGAAVKDHSLIPFNLGIAPETCA